MKVTDPLGRTWRVSRRWVPWRRQVKKIGAVDTPLSASKSDIDLLAMLQWLLYLPKFVVWVARMLELLLLVLLVPATILVRLIFRRPWPVEVRRGFKPWWEMPSGTWRESGDRIRAISQAVARGEVPPRTT